MSTDIRHLGREYSDSAVIGGKGLIQLGHLTADAGQGLHQVDLNAHIGQVQRGLHARNAPSDNQNVFYHDVFLR